LTEADACPTGKSHQIQPVLHNHWCFPPIIKVAFAVSVPSFLGHPSLFFRFHTFWLPGTPHSPDGVRAPGGPAARPWPGVGRPPPVALPPPPRWDGIPPSSCGFDPFTVPASSFTSVTRVVWRRNTDSEFFEDISCCVHPVLVTSPNIAPDISDTIIFPSNPLQFYFCSCGRPKRPPPPTHPRDSE